MLLTAFVVTVSLCYFLCLQAHSKAEDEFIWPAMKKKLNQIQATVEVEATLRDSPACPDSTSTETLEKMISKEEDDDHGVEEKLLTEIDKQLLKVKRLLCPKSSRNNSSTNTSSDTNSNSGTRPSTTSASSGGESAGEGWGKGKPVPER